ncbi:hypothetical protein ACN27F_14410 [Solwaraspora sp. WMMB335]|uniref:hypothetical protein n=1 Tax=Solwaraspora sp. WMMB335 TaxID=3404118 RepID=UPI003B95557A
MSQSKTKRIPGPLYAVAGAGDLAYQRLRRLPVAMTRLTGRAAVTTAGLREKATQSSAELRQRATDGADFDRLRALALRNRDAMVAGAQAAGARAVIIYGNLVAHGERVVGTGVVRAADTVNADMDATEAPAQVEAAGQAVQPADKATGQAAQPADKAAEPAA